VRALSNPRLLGGALCAAAAAIALGACGSTVSTSAFKGEEHEVAQTVADLQSDATAGEASKICANDVAAGVVSRLGGKTACEHAIKEQLSEIDSLEASVESVQVNAAKGTATATVKSTYAGKSRITQVSLVKEGGRWKVQALG
jgi:copper chaperone CopZ